MVRLLTWRRAVLALVPAACRSAKKWGDVEFPAPFGRTMTSQEEYVHSLDEGSGAQPLPFSCCPPRSCPSLPTALPLLPLPLPC